MEKLVKTI